MRYALIFLILVSSIYTRARACVAQTVPSAITPHFLPRGRQARVAKVEQRCFTLEEYKIVLRIDFDLHQCHLRFSLLEEKLSLQEALVELFRGKAASFQVDRDVWKAEYDRLHGRWLADNQAKHECEAEGIDHAFWLMLGGELAITVTAAAIIFFISSG